MHHNESLISSVGRRCRLHDPLVRRRLIEAGRAGLGAKSAADFAGISRSTFFDWFKRAREARERIDRGEDVGPREALFLDFLDEFDQVMATREVEALAVVFAAAERGEWRAAAWFLERSFPDRWGQRTWRQKQPDQVPEVSVEALERLIKECLGENS